MNIQKLPNIRLEQQIGYNKYLVRALKEECNKLQESYYSKGKKPSVKKLRDLKDKEYMGQYYWREIKERITELKRRRDLGIVITES